LVPLRGWIILASVAVATCIGDVALALSVPVLRDPSRPASRKTPKPNRLAPAPRPQREIPDLPGDSRLVSRLLNEYDTRQAAAAARREPAAPGPVEFFDNKHAIVFATTDGEARKIAAWLEDFFALEVLIVEDRTYFQEWLYRCAAATDMILVDRAAFPERSALSRFVAVARGLHDADLPVIAFGDAPPDATAQPAIGLYCDVTLVAPVSLDALCRGVKRAADIIVDGRSD